MNGLSRKKVRIFIIIVTWFFFSLHASVYALSDLKIGYDVSFPNCDQTAQFPTNGFGIVGVNNGRAFTKNPCLFSEYTRAIATSKQASLYMNLNAPIGSTVSRGMSGPSTIFGFCLPKDVSCQLFNYGYNAADFAYRYASSKISSATMWWVDVELANSWFDDPLQNRKVIEGTVAFFRGGLSPNGAILLGKGMDVGIYSTNHMWNDITGAWDMGTIPSWVATDDHSPPDTCPKPFTGLNAKTYLVQFYNEDLVLDEDINCLR